MSRLPRFKRVASLSPIALTGRDREIIQHVFRHRFLRSGHIISLVKGSRQQLLRRLQTLYHHGYLDRPRAQIDYYRAGSQAMVYGVGHKGIKLLEREFQVPRRKADWTAKNRTVTRFFLEHTLAAADVMVALEAACHKREDVELVWHKAAHEESFKWSVAVAQGGTLAEIGVVPDRIFGIRQKSQSNEIAWLFLEADCATMPVRRSGLKQSSFYRKLAAYHETWRQNLLDSFPRFRVLTVTTTPERVNHLIAAAKTATRGKGAGLFLFADRTSFVAAANPLSLPMRNGRAEIATLL